MRNTNKALRILIDSKRNLIEKITEATDKEECNFLEGKLCGIQVAIDVLSNKY